MLKEAIILICLILVLPTISADIFINEIMYNPDQCSDYDCEWIELFNNGSNKVNLSDWKLDNKDFDDFILEPNSYLVIAKELIDGTDTDNESFEAFWGNNDNIWNTNDGFNAVDGSFTLSNSGDTIELSYNGSIIDSVTYTKNVANGNNYSIERANNTWKESIQIHGTPGKRNSIAENQSKNQSQNQSNKTCDWSIQIKPLKEIFSLGEIIKWKIALNEPNNCGNTTFSYWIEDSFGKVIKNPIQKFSTTSQTLGWYQKTLTQPGGYILIANLTKFGCNDTSKENNLAAKSITIKGQNNNSANTQPLNSAIHILDIDNKKFCQTMHIELNIYKGDTEKYAIYIHAENKETKKKVSEETKIHMKNKFSNATFRVPLKMKCSHLPGKYQIIAEGLDTQDKKTIEIKKEDEDRTSEDKSFSILTSSNPNNEDSLVTFNNPLSTKQITGQATKTYISKNTKMKKIASMLLTILLLLSIAHFLLERKSFKSSPSQYE